MGKEVDVELVGSCLRRNDGWGRRNDGKGGPGMMEWGWRGRLGRERAAGGCSVPLTPHLTSPLKGGRDELGKETGWGRRGDGRKCRNNGV